MRAIAATAGCMMFLVAVGAMACQCATLSLAKRVAEADLVLVGKVLSHRPIEYVMVSPTEVFKGAASKALTIRTGTSDCDFFLPPVRPQVGEEYLLFLRQSEDWFTASRCLASGRTGDKVMELQALRRKP